MDILFAVKLGAIVIAVIGAVVAAGSDLAEGERKRRWTIAGLAVGLLGGFAAIGLLLYEQREAAEASRRVLDRHAEQMRAVQQVLTESQRQLSPLNPSRIDVFFDLPGTAVDDPTRPMSFRMGDVLIAEKQFAERVDVAVYLWAAPVGQETSKAETKGDNADMSFRGVVSGEASSGMGRNDRGAVSWFAGFEVRRDERWARTHRMTSIRDLPGARILIRVGDNGDADGSTGRILKAMSLSQFIVRFDLVQLRLPMSRGREIECERGRCFVMEFPKTYEEVMAMRE